MGRSKDEMRALVGGAGILAGIFTDLLALVSDRDGVYEDVHRLTTPAGKLTMAKIADLIVGKSAEVASAAQVASSAVLAWVIGLCRFTHVHDSITAEHFPCQPDDFAGRNVKIVALGRDVSIEQALVFLDKQGLRPATLMELFWWWLNNHKEHEKCRVVALGSVWDGVVPYICDDGHDCELWSFLVMDGLNADFSFAAVRKDKAA